MSVPALAAAMLLAGAPVNQDSIQPAAPVPQAAPVARDQEVGVPADPAVAPAPPPPVAPPSPVAPTEAQPPAEPAAPPPSSDMDQGDIVVTGRLRTPADPLEKANAKSYEVTQSVDKAFVGPVALAYKKKLPGPIRSGLRNFLNNVREPTVFVNFLLQLKPGKAMETVGRFAINTTIGGAGLFDVAKRRPFKLPRRPNGFADSLGYYGVKPGPYLFLPLIGPTTVRDLIGDISDQLLLPLSVGRPFNRLPYEISTGVLIGLDRRAEFDEQLRRLRETADPYVATRTYYLQGRQAEIDHLRGRDRGADSPASELTHPAIDPSPPPGAPATAPAAPSSAPGENPATATPPGAPTQPPPE